MRSHCLRPEAQRTNEKGPLPQGGATASRRGLCLREGPLPQGGPTASSLSKRLSLIPFSHVVTCNVFTCHVVTCHVFTCHVVTCHVVTCHVVTCHVFTCHVVTCNVVTCHVVTCHVVTCHVVTCHVVTCHVVTCHVVTCHVVTWTYGYGCRRRGGGIEPRAAGQSVGERTAGFNAPLEAQATSGRPVVRVGSVQLGASLM
ncbi:unnamed protein product [Boreogadus saida]